MNNHQKSAYADRTARYGAAAAAFALIGATIVWMAAACTIAGESDDDGQRGGKSGGVYYSITFDPNGGNFTKDGGAEAAEFRIGQSGPPPEAAREGWSLIAWNTEPDNSGTDFVQSIPLSGGMTFYAIWNPENASIETANPEEPWNGGFQEVTINETGTYCIELWGAQGGPGINTGATEVAGGKGGYTKGNIELEAGTKLYFYIGGARVPGKPNSASGSYNGGGSGINDPASNVGAGGGATDVRMVRASTDEPSDHPASLASRIMVAAGGGGASSNAVALGGSTDGKAWAGGEAGGETGEKGKGNSKPNGGNQTAGGTATGTGTYGGGNGAFGKGGSVNYNTSTHQDWRFETAGGGGAGWFGGGSGTHDGDNSSGAGGSSYISGHNGCTGTSNPNGFTAKSGSGIEKSKSYTGLFFTGTQIINGKTSMPKPDGPGNETGHEGPGAAKITKLP
ncbi:MAG: InlB B-repeat-containing protein [Spirochaetaceae bacterium]|jgi:hypothetical protein|nr:InlB B-repeat-containing protein [Spirochaetaceae bacterium]